MSMKRIDIHQESVPFGTTSYSGSSTPLIEVHIECDLYFLRSDENMLPGLALALLMGLWL